MSERTELIAITPAAADQIRQSARQGKMEGLAMRIACLKKDDGSLQYAMGFDDRGRDEDVEIKVAGIQVVMGADTVPLVKGMEIDYVDLGQGEFNFIFKNPNDPNYSPPTEM